MAGKRFFAERRREKGPKGTKRYHPCQGPLILPPSFGQFEDSEKTYKKAERDHHKSQKKLLPPGYGVHAAGNQGTDQVEESGESPANLIFLLLSSKTAGQDPGRGYRAG